MLAIILGCNLCAAQNNKSAKQQITIKIPKGTYGGQQSAHTVIMNWFTQMDKNGELTMNFEINVKEFFKPNSEDANVRLCMGLREKINSAEKKESEYINTNDYDIVQLSLLNFSTPIQ